MSTRLVENTISQNRPARTSELGTFVPVAEVSDLGELLAGADSCSRAPTSLRSATVRIGLGETDDCPRPRACRGFTLVELLVVVFILLLVSAASIPIIAPALQGRHIREASRQVNSYFAVARDTALRNGRPVGVSIERFASLDAGGNVAGVPEMSVLLQQVEVPESYSGDFADSMMTIEYEVNTATGAVMSAHIVSLASTTGGADVGWTDLIRASDRVQLNNGGRWYSISSDSSSTQPGKFLSATPQIASPAPATSYWNLQSLEPGIPIVMPAGAQLINDNYYQIQLPYTILRQPIKTATPPLQLTGTVIIDLNWSGDDRRVFVERDLSNLATAIPNLTATYAPVTTLVEDVQPIIIMFGPSGALERIYRSEYVPAASPDPAFWSWTDHQPTGPIHLMLGQRDGVPANDNIGDEPQSTNNWRNLDNLWVTIHPQTGLITTTENGESADQSSPWPNGLRDARYFATRAKSMGGR